MDEVGEGTCDNCDMFVKKSYLTEIDTGLLICRDCLRYYQKGQEFLDMMEADND